MTAAAIVAGMPIATRWTARPSAPHSQSLTPRATSNAVAPADHRGDEAGDPAAPAAEQSQRQHRRHHGEHREPGEAQHAHHRPPVSRRRVVDRRQERRRHHVSPTHGGASTPQRLSPVRRSTRSTSSSRGWNESALSSSTRSDASVVSSRSKSNVTHALLEHVRPRRPHVGRAAPSAPRTAGRRAPRWALRQPFRPHTSCVNVTSTR